MYFLLALAKLISPTQQLHYAIKISINQLVGGGWGGGQFPLSVLLRTATRVCAVRRQRPAKIYVPKCAINLRYVPQSRKNKTRCPSDWSSIRVLYTPTIYIHPLQVREHLRFGGTMAAPYKFRSLRVVRDIKISRKIHLN